MAPKAAKRAAAKQGPKQQPAAKSQKVEAARAKAPTCDPAVEAVLQVVKSAATLPDSCKAMLLAMVPGSLSTASDERCDVHSLVVAMVGELMEETRAKMLGAVEAERTKVAKAQATKDDLEGALSEAEGHLASATEATAAKRAALGEAETTLSEKERELSEARAVQTNGDAELDAAGREKERYEAAFEAHFKALRDEEQEASRAQEHLAVLLPLVEKLTPDDSLRATLPTACAKAPSARGNFDHMVMQELEKLISERIAGLTQTLEAGGPAAAERAAAVTAAEEALEAARAARQSSESAVAEARAAQDETAKSVEPAKASLVSFEAEYEAAEGALRARVQELERFQASNVASFTALRDKVAKPLVSVQLAAEGASERHVQAQEVAEEVIVATPVVQVVEDAPERQTEVIGEVAADFTSKEAPEAQAVASIEVGGE